MEHLAQFFCPLSVFSSSAECQILEPHGFLWLASLERQRGEINSSVITAHMQHHLWGSLDQRYINGDSSASDRPVGVHTQKQKQLSQKDIPKLAFSPNPELLDIDLQPGAP